MSNTYVTIIDNTGRNILGVLSNDTKDTLDILNPVMITVQPQNGQFQVQLIPLFLAEFISSDEKKLRNFTYRYSKANIAVGINENSNVAKTSTPPATGAKTEIIKLFED